MWRYQSWSCFQLQFALMRRFSALGQVASYCIILSFGWESDSLKKTMSYAISSHQLSQTILLSTNEKEMGVKGVARNKIALHSRGCPEILSSYSLTLPSSIPSFPLSLICYSWVSMQHKRTPQKASQQTKTSIPFLAPQHMLAWKERESDARKG